MIIMYVLGIDLNLNAVKNFMNFWDFVQIPDMFYNEKGYFILKFRSCEHKDNVMMKDSYTIHNMPMLLRIWHHDSGLTRDMLKNIPVRVKLP